MIQPPIKKISRCRIIGLLPLLWINTAWGTLHKNWVCAGVVQEMRRLHSIQSLSGAHTDQALSAIRTFRIQTLGQPGARPAWQPHVWVKGSTARDTQIQVVAQHLRGIEASKPDLEKGPLDEAGVLVGITLKGEATIRQWWQDLNQSAQRIGKMSDAGDFGSWTMRITGTFLGITEIKILMMYPDSPLSLLPLLLIGIWGNVDSIPRFLWEQDDRFDHKQTIIDQVLLSLKGPKLDWFFFSTSYQNNLMLIDEIWKTGFVVNPKLIRSVDYLRTHSFHTAATSRVINTVLAIVSGRSTDTLTQNMRQTWVIWDGLLTKDPLTQEPHLIQFLRLTQKRPPYPKPAPKKEWRPLPGTPQLQPVPNH